MYLYASWLQISLKWYLNILHKDNRDWKGLQEIAANPAQQWANFKYEISPERGHHLKNESVWRMRGTTWGGGGGRMGIHAETCCCTLLWLSLLIRTVIQLGNTENGESAASARKWWRNYATGDPPLPWHKSPRLLLPWTLWMKVCKAQWCGSAVPSHWALHVYFFEFLICLLLVCFIIYILYCVTRVNVINLGLFFIVIFYVLYTVKRITIRGTYRGNIANHFHSEL